MTDEVREGARFAGQPLAEALARMRASPGDDAARLAFHGVLADSELFLMLDGDDGPAGSLRPRLFDLTEGRVALVFDSEARLAEFAGQAVDYAALPGRVLVSMLAAEGLALLVNPDSDDAAMLAADALQWLAATLTAPAPSEASARAAGFAPPALDDAALARLRSALERRLSGVPGLRAAVLATALWDNAEEGLVLALAGVPAPAQAALARAVAEALALSGLDGADAQGAGAVSVDVIFPSTAVMERVAGVGLMLSPAPFQPFEQDAAPRPAPGMDPRRPPRLR